MWGSQGPYLGIGPADVPDIGGGGYTAVERVIGSRFNDYLVGNSTAKEINGGTGADHADVDGKRPTFSTQTQRTKLALSPCA